MKQTVFFSTTGQQNNTLQAPSNFIKKKYSLINKQKLLIIAGLGIFFLFVQFSVSGQFHPHYLHALSDLRAARWMIDHRPTNNWQASVDEVEAVRRIDAAIFEIKRAAIDDGRDIYDHVNVDEHPDHIGRLHDAVDFLRKAQQDVNMDEDNMFANGLQGRALMHINEAIRLTERTIATIQQPQYQPAGHPYYLHALADLRLARWMIEHRPGNWQATEEEIAAVERIDAAINEIKRAAIDDGRDINDHVYADERPDHMERLHDAIEFLRRAQQDINMDSDNMFANGLQNRALVHIDEAIRHTERAMHSF